MKLLGICLFILVLLFAVIVQQVFERLINLPVPEKLPENSTWAFKANGFCIGIARDLVSGNPHVRDVNSLGATG